MKKAFLFIKKEFMEMLPPTIFFLIIFHITAFIRALMAEQYGITITSTAYATIGALIVGKAILIADKFPILQIFKDKLAIYNVLWKVFIYFFIVLLFQFAEEMIPLISEHGSFNEAFHYLASEIKWPRFWATHIFLMLFLIIYVVSVEVIKIIGRENFIKIFFGLKDNKPENTQN